MLVRDIYPGDVSVWHLCQIAKFIASREDEVEPGDPAKVIMIISVEHNAERGGRGQSTGALPKRYYVRYIGSDGKTGAFFSGPEHEREHNVLARFKSDLPS